MSDINSEPMPPERLMVMMAHPDDVEFLLGGTVAKWAQAGTVVSYVLATRGDAGSHEPGMTRHKLGQLREAEQREAARVFGVQEVQFLGYHDGEVEPTLTLRRELVRHIRRFKPDAVATFDPTNLFVRDNYINHPDHRAMGQAVLDAVAPAAAMPLNFVDLIEEGLVPHRVKTVWLAVPTSPNTWIDITEVIELKLISLYKHHSQFDGNHERINTLLKEWAAEAGQHLGVTYAEGFKRLVLGPEEEV